MRNPRNILFYYEDENGVLITYAIRRGIKFPNRTKEYKALDDMLQTGKTKRYGYQTYKGQTTPENW